MNTPTPHNAAKLGEIAKTVLMPGDPLRAKYIAENFLEDYTCYSTVRGMLGFTGYYKGIKISIQGSGMGVPSMGIYSYELFNFYNVENIIRIGSAGSLANTVASKEANEIKLRDILVAKTVDTDSNYLNIIKKDKIISPDVSEGLLSKLFEISKQLNLAIKAGKIYTSDLFYMDKEDLIEMSKKDIIGVEMETLSLYTNAAIAKKNAIAIFTVSDNPILNKAISISERQIGFDKMIKLALELAIKC
ncbi:MAG: purine-nucleoside phosphorylase [Clostridia bacterium]